MAKTVTLTGNSLTVEDVVAVARRGAALAVDAAAATRADQSRAVVQRLIDGGAAIYGVTTGFGRLASERIGPASAAELQRNLILSHAAGLGPPLPADVVRAIMVLRANVLLKTTSGVRAVLAQRIAELVNAGIHPVVPEQGSVGASGDLAPLSHVALALMGEGEVTVDRHGSSPVSPARGTATGEHGDLLRPGLETSDPGFVPARDALRAAGIEPVVFQAKEGLAFINGTQAQSAVLALLVHDARNLWRTAHGAAAMSLEALLGTPAPFDARLHAARPHRGQVTSAQLLTDLLAGSEIRESHRSDDPRVQDAYSLRCTPQILGAAGDALEFAAQTVEVELNAATDNPLVFGEEIVSGGNFHGQPVALALDVLAIALTTMAGLSERRIERLVNPDLSQGLPPFLTPRAGLQSGLMMVQVSAAALVGESRTLCTPASVQSIPTDANQEDVVPMGMAAAFKARRILANAQRAVAAELLCAAQGLEFRKPLGPGAGVQQLYRRVRAVVPALEDDRPLTPDVERLAALVAREALI